MPVRGEVHVLPWDVHHDYWVPRSPTEKKWRPTLVAWPPDDRPPWATLVEGTSESPEDGPGWVRDDQQRLVTLKRGEAGTEADHSRYWFHGDPGRKHGRIAAVEGDVVMQRRHDKVAPGVHKVDQAKQTLIRLALDSWCEVNARVHPSKAGWEPYNRKKPAPRIEKRWR